MKRHFVYLAAVLLFATSVHAFTILDESYTLQNFAQYSSSTYSGRMEFDGSGNLYINHFTDGRIQKINSSGQVSTLTTGLEGPGDMTWGGGTAYGDYLYVSDHSNSGNTDRIVKISLTGTSSSFAGMGSQVPDAVEIDRTGNYGNYLYTTTSGTDRIHRIDLAGNVSTFVNWPGFRNGGGAFGLAFDPTGTYNGKMYAASMFGQDSPSVSGLFMVNPNGTVSRFSNDFAGAVDVDFDASGLYFDHDMFVMGRASFTAQNSLWRVGTNGVAEEFMTNVNSFAFGADGAMYVSYYNWGTQVVSVARVVPEPATMLLLAAGALCLRRRMA